MKAKNCSDKNGKHTVRVEKRVQSATKYALANHRVHYFLYHFTRVPLSLAVFLILEAKFGISLSFNFSLFNLVLYF